MSKPKTLFGLRCLSYKELLHSLVYQQHFEVSIHSVEECLKEAKKKVPGWKCSHVAIRLGDAVKIAKTEARIVHPLESVLDPEARMFDNGHGLATDAKPDDHDLWRWDEFEGKPCNIWYPESAEFTKEYSPASNAIKISVEPKKKS